MNKFLLGVLALVSFCLSTNVWARGRSPASASKKAPLVRTMTDTEFLNKFSVYKSKNNATTYRAAKAWGSHLRQSPAAVLKRYIATKYNDSKNTDAVIVEAVDAFKESGLSHEQSLAAVSDIVGQLTETLNNIYNRASGNSSAS